MKKIIVLLGTVGLVVVLAWWWGGQSNHLLTVTFFDVGQGDAALIRTPQDQTILIDGGPDRTILTKLGESLPWTRRTIDLVILSHPHADHVAGLNYVLARYRVRHVLMTGAIHTTPEYLKFLELLKNKEVPVTIAQAGQVIELNGGVSVEVLWPFKSVVGERVNDLNITSIVNRVVYKATAMLFTGDTLKENEAALLNSGSDLTAQILKVAHQGSRTSSSEEFIKAVAPEVAVIPVGQNSYGHPHAEVVERLKKLVEVVLRTDAEGDITWQSNGQSWQRE